MNFFNRVGQSNFYWLAMVVAGLALEGTALFYQYVLDYPPCVLCIHIRLWVMAFVLIGLLALIIQHPKFRLLVLNPLSLISAIGFLERAWKTLATERRWIEGACTLETGLPEWFAPDKWLPSVFEVKTSCGYTPYIFFKVSMAEILVGIAVLTVIATTLITIASLIKRN